MRASVVVPVRNGSAFIGRCVEALLAQDLPQGSLEVIVVDDGSTDDTAAIVQQYPEVRIISERPKGPAAARNRGVAEAQGEYVLFTDADCVPRPDWARFLISRVEEANAVGGKGVYASTQPSLVARFVQIEYETKYRRMAQRQDIDFVDTYSAIYRRDIFLEVGGFDETLPSASVEDQEFSFRVAERGHRLVFVPEAVVEHIHADTVWRYARKKFNIGYWKVAVLAAHPTKALSDSHTPQVLKVQMALTALLGLLILLSPLGSGLRTAAAITGGSLLASYLPFVLYALRRDPAVATVAPALLLVRALALGSGLVWGMLHSKGLLLPANRSARAAHTDDRP